MFFWNSLVFSMIQRMLAIWSLVPLPFLNSLLSEPPEKLTYFFKAVPFSSLYCFYLLHAMSTINGFPILCAFSLFPFCNVFRMAFHTGAKWSLIVLLILMPLINHNVQHLGYIFLKQCDENLWLKVFFLSVCQFLTCFDGIPLKVF